MASAALSSALGSAGADALALALALLLLRVKLKAAGGELGTRGGIGAAEKSKIGTVGGAADVLRLRGGANANVAGLTLSGVTVADDDELALVELEDAPSTPATAVRRVTRRRVTAGARCGAGGKTRSIVPSRMLSTVASIDPVIARSRAIARRSM
jgi:hypothetical protein